MSVFDIPGLASRIAPILVVMATASVAVASPSGAWPIPFSIAAVALLLLAVAMLAHGGLRNWLRGLTVPMEQLGFKRNRDQFWFAMNAKGMPRGYRTVAFIAFLGLLFSGLRFPYLAVAIAAMLLTLVWGLSNRRFPADDVEGE